MNIRSSKAFLIAATGLSMLMAACVTSGKYFSSDTGWIKANKTSQEDVRGLLGEPFMVGNSGGSPTWTYGFYRYKLLGDSFTKELKLYWNNDKTVQSYSFNSSFPEDISATGGGSSRARTVSDRPVSPPEDDRPPGDVRR